MNGALIIKTKSVLKKLFSGRIDTDMTKITDKFWDEHKAFMMETAHFDQKSRFNFPDAVERNHIRHEK